MRKGRGPKFLICERSRGKRQRKAKKGNYGGKMKMIGERI